MIRESLLKSKCPNCGSKTEEISTLYTCETKYGPISVPDVLIQMCTNDVNCDAREWIGPASADKIDRAMELLRKKVEDNGR